MSGFDIGNAGIHHARVFDQPSSKAPSRAVVQFFVPAVSAARQYGLEYSRYAIEAATNFCRVVSFIGLPEPADQLGMTQFRTRTQGEARYSYSYSMHHVSSSSRSTSTAALSTSTNKGKH